MKRPVAAMVIVLITLGVSAFSVPAAATPTAAPGGSLYDDLWGVRLVRGLLILKVDDASPAAKAGLRHGDILEGFNDKRVGDFSSLGDFTAAFRGAARQRDLAATVWQLDRVSGAYRHATIALRLPDSAEAKIGLALMPGVFFREVRADGLAGRSGVLAWDCIEAIERESLADRSRLDDFDAHVTSLQNHQGNVRVAIVHWRPVDSQAAQPMESAGEREVLLPAAAR
jgi:S1-C subfamily serine protease